MNPRMTIRMKGVLLLLGFVLAACQAQQAAPPTSAPATKAPAPTAAPAAQPAPTQAPAKPAATPAQQAQPTAAPTESIKIGIMVALTNSARVGTNYDRYSRMAIDDINAKGGVKVGGKTYKLEAVTADDKYNADGGREAANRLVLAEKVKFIIDGSSGSTAGAQPITEPNKVLMFSSITSDKSLGPRFPLTFVLGYAHFYMRAKALYDWLAKDHPSIKRVAFALVDDAGGHSIADPSEIEAKAHGVDVVTKEFFPADVKDFNPVVTRALRENPQALQTAWGGRGPQFLAMMRVLTDLEFKGQVYGVSVDEVPLREAANFINNYTVTAMINWKDPLVTPKEQEIITRAMNKWGEAEMDGNAVSHYNIPYVLAQVIEKAGTIDDTVKIAQTFREGSWDTIWSDKWGKSKVVGAKTFGQSAVLEQPIYLTNVQNKKIITSGVSMGTMP